MPKSVFRSNAASSRAAWRQTSPFVFSHGGHLMHTNIDQFDERTGKRAGKRHSLSTNDLVRQTEWLSWPILSWSGASPHAKLRPEVNGHTLHSHLADKLQSLPAGLYALHLANGLHRDLRLLPIDAERLAMAAHAIAIANHGADKVSRERDASFAKRSRLHAHVAQLGSHLSALSSSPKSDSHRQCWRLSATDVLPPTAIDAALHGISGSYRNAARLAVMEYVLSATNANLSRFCSALQQLFSECQYAIGEPERRRGIFLSLIKETEALCPAYLKCTFSSRTRERIVKWKPNPAFPPLVVEAFFRDYRPAQLSASLSAEEKARFGFEEVAEWLVGTKLPAFKKGPLIESDVLPDVATRMRESMRSLTVNPATPWLNRFAALAGRCSAIADDPTVPEQMAAWLKACRVQCRQTADGSAVWNLAVTSLERWLGTVADKPENVRLISALVANRGSKLICFHQTQKPESTTLWNLGMLGAISLKTAEAIIDLNLVEPATQFFTQKPERLAGFTNLLSSHRADWEQLLPYQKKRWISIFTEIQSAPLQARLLQWVNEILSRKKAPFVELENCVGCFSKFLRMNRSTEHRRRRECFLHTHLPLLDRIFDEAEYCVQLLPEKGFEHWRSAADLWSKRFVVFEFAYHWQEAKFPAETSLLDDLFKWIRSKDRKDIAQSTEYPRYHFYRIHGNEALLVRLSGGNAKQLLALLDVYIENWRWPDDPYKGWIFLDRFPAVQHFLVQLCGDAPWRLREIARVLWRISLALRLNCRFSLRIRLKMWETAAAIEEPIAAWKAFAQHIGGSNPFPDAINRIFAQEDRLRREYETLSKLRDTGPLSESALRRLSKLDRLLQQPPQIAQWAEKEARKALAKRLPGLKMHVLNLHGRRTLREHWRLVFRGSRAPKTIYWDHALRFYYTADENKDILRQLLRHVAHGDTRWRLRHPPNARFLDDLRRNGFGADAWLDAYETTSTVRGEKWSLYKEQDPLQILRMGDLFGTCLSVDDSNAFSAIANAIELNKQVLYLRNQRDAIMGRKLIGLTADGRFFGFRSYGASSLNTLDSPEKPGTWIKIMFDLACLELVQKVDARFDRSRDPSTAANKLKLSAEWYNDGPEPFDWWITLPKLTQSILAADRETVAVAVLHHIHQSGFDIQSHPAAAMETLRALLWLADEAALVLESLGPESFKPAALRFLACHTASEQVRSLVTPHIRQAHRGI